MKELDIKSTTDKENGKNDLIKVENKKIIQLFLYEEQEPLNSSYLYEWKVGATSFTDEYENENEYSWLSSYRGERKILLVLNNFYCGEHIIVNLAHVKKQLWEKGNMEVFDNISWNPYYNGKNRLPIVLLPRSISRIFIAQCPVLFKTVKWLNNEYEELNMSHTFFENNSKGYIYIDVEGLNSNCIRYELLYDEESSGINKTFIWRNSVYIPYSIPIKYFKHHQISSITIKLNLIDYEDFSNSNIKNLGKIYDKQAILFGIENYFYEARKKLLGELLEPVVVGDVYIYENNHNPCKFTKVTFTLVGEELREAIVTETYNKAKSHMNDMFDISLEMTKGNKEDDEVVVFDETSPQSNRFQSQDNIFIYPIVAGSKDRDIILTVDNFDVNKCKLKDKHKYEIVHNLKKLELKDRYKYEVVHNLKKLELKKKERSTYQYKHQAHYNYGGKFMLFTNLWPSLSRQRSELIIDSCRHSKVRIYEDIYPDVKWALTFSIGTKTDKDTGKFKLDSSIAMAASWDDENKDMSLSISYPFTNIRQQIEQTIDGRAALEIKDMAINYIDSLTNGGFSVILRVVDNVIRFLCKFQEANDNITGFYGQLNQHEMATVRKSFKVEPIWPKLSLGASWKATTHKQHIGTLLEGAISGTLMGFEATVDLYCCMKKFGTIGAYIETVDWILKHIFDIDVKFEIVFKGTISGKGTTSYNTASSSGSQKLSVTGKIDVSINLEASQDSSYSATIETEAYGAEGTSGLYVTMDLKKFNKGESHDTPQDGLYGDITAGLGAIEVGIFKQKTTETRQDGEGSIRPGKGKVPDKEYIGGKRTLLEEQNFVRSKTDTHEEVEYLRVLVW